MLGEILGAVGSIAGGLLGNKAAEKAQKQNYAAQQDVLHNQLQYRAADAEKAGISKVFAMGAPTQSFSPTSVGGNFDFLGNAGQNIGRAMEAGQSGPQQAVSKIGQQLTLEGMQLDNDFKRAQLSSLIATGRQAGHPPGIPSPNTMSFIPGQGNSTQGETVVSTKLDTANPNDPSAVPGITPENMLTRTNSGGYSVTLPPAMQEALESEGDLAQTQYALRNRLGPLTDKSRIPKEIVLNQPPNTWIYYNPFYGEYQYKPLRGHRYTPRVPVNRGRQ